MNGYWQLCVNDQFSAAHALRHYHGKCENPHGHNFEVEVKVEGREIDARTGMLLDFGTLKTGLREIIATLDHHDLNELEPFKQANPSSENLAKYVAERMIAFLENCPDPQAPRARLVSVSVSEKSTQSATWIVD